jgi:hypothetical protein
VLATRSSNIWQFTFKAKILTDQNIYTIAYRSWTA